jgi:hypothetical protein
MSSCLSVAGHCVAPAAPRPSVPNAANQPHGRRLSVVAKSASWDPEGLYSNSPEMSGIIDRKLMGNRAQDDQKSKTVMEKFMQAHKEEVQVKRDSRVVPDDKYELIAYLLDTEASDMNYEVARCRPLLDDEFFAVLNKQIGMEQLSLEKDEDKLAELELLRDYLDEAIEAVDKATQEVATAPERLKKLLESPNKKDCLRDMAAAGEIDQSFMDLLQQNIEGAEEAGREDVVQFMTKVKVASAKFLI